MRELSAAELAEWQAYYFIEPWGDDWLRSAQLAQLFANANRNSKEQPDPYKIWEFMPRWPGIDMEPSQLADNLSQDNNQADEIEDVDYDDLLEDVETEQWKGWKELFKMMSTGSGEAKGFESEKG